MPSTDISSTCLIWAWPAAKALEEDSANGTAAIASAAAPATANRRKGARSARRSSGVFLSPGLQVFQEHIKRAKNPGPGYALLSRIYINMHLFQKAVEAGKQAVTFLPDNPGPWYNLGEAYSYQPGRPRDRIYNWYHHPDGCLRAIYFR